MKSKWGRKQLLMGIAAIAVLLVAAGCGSSSSSTSSSASTSGGSTNASSGSSCKDQVTKVVDQQKQPVSWGNPGPAFDTSGIKGKTIHWISLNADIPFTQSVFAGFKQAAQKVGVNFKFFDGAGNASQEARGVQQAIAAHADLIMIQSIPIPQISTAIAAANKAKIPVVEAFNTDAGAPPDPGTQAAVTYNYTAAGQMMSDDAIRISDCKVDAVTFTTSDEAVAPFGVKGIQGEMTKYCPDTCSTKVQDARIAEWSTRLPVLARNAVANPKVNWLMPLYDGETQFTNPAVMQAGAASRVNVASFNATKGIVDQLAKSGNPLAVDIGSPLAWSGWAIADQSFRLLANQKPVVDEKIPLRTFDRDNIGEIDLSKPESTWYGTKTNYETEYEKLWGVGQ
jgi:ribose transport system substrate-binding protein